MDKTYLLRRSATSGAEPTAATGTTGELIANTYDGRLWLRGNSGTNTIYEITRPLVSTIAQSGAFTGQSIIWNGTNWNTEFVNIPVDAIEQSGASSGQYIRYDGGEGYWIAATIEPMDFSQAGATSGQCLAWSGSAWAPAARLTRTVNVQTFTSSGTWTKPAGAVSVAISMSGGGAGGNFGSTTASSPACIGGAAGEGIITVLAADLLAATEGVTIGAGGTGGVGAGVGNIPAAVNATFGSPTRFGTTEIKAFAFGGGGGANQFAGNYATKQTNLGFNPNFWGSGGATSAPNQSGASGSLFSAGGGAGAVALGASGFAGGVTNSFAIVEGTFARTPVRGGGGAGGATGATGVNGTAGSVHANGYGSGGGGGGAPAIGATTATGGNGGAGIRGSGGGGGGRGGSSSAGSNGGAGGNGFAIITTVCYT